MRFALNTTIALLIILGVQGRVGTMAADNKKSAHPSNHTKTKPMKSDSLSVTITSELLERLLADYQPSIAAELFDHLSIDSEEQRKIYPAFQAAEKAAREKQRALSAAKPGKIVMKAGDSVEIKALNVAAIDACVNVFSKDLKIAISSNTRKILCLWAHQKLSRDFTDTFTVQLQKEDRVLSPDGKIVSGVGIRSSADRHTPLHLRGYFFRISRLIDGKPAPGTEIALPGQTLEGQRYDFLTIKTEEEATKPAAEKPKELPAK